MMPIYEYVCRKCARRFEKLRDMKDTSDVECPACGKTAERIIATRTSIIGSSREPGHPCCGGEDHCDGSSCAQGGGCCK